MKAIIKNGVVANIIVAGESYEPPEGTSLVDLGPGCVVGASFDGSTFTPPAPVAPSSEDINAERERRLIAGVTISVNGYGDIPLQGRPADQINLLALKDTARDLDAAGVTAAVIPFRDADNVTHMLTPDQMMELADSGKTAASAIYQASWAIKARNDLATIDIADDQYWSA